MRGAAPISGTKASAPVSAMPMLPPITSRPKVRPRLCSQPDIPLPAPLNSTATAEASAADHGAMPSCSISIRGRKPASDR